MHIKSAQVYSHSTHTQPPHNVLTQEHIYMLMDTAANALLPSAALLYVSAQIYPFVCVCINVSETDVRSVCVNIPP